MGAWRFNGVVVVGGEDLSWFFARQIAMAYLGAGPEGLTWEATTDKPTLVGSWDGSDAGPVPTRRLLVSMVFEQPAKKLPKSKRK